MYRLVIDFPCGENEVDAKTLAKLILSSITFDATVIEKAKVQNAQYRLARDEDRRPKNHLNINENGHASGEKAILFP